MIIFETFAAAGARDFNDWITKRTHGGTNRDVHKAGGGGEEE